MPPPSAQAAPVRRTGAGFGWTPLFLLAVTGLVYARSLDAPWLFDDAGAVLGNASIRSFSTALLPPADGSTTTGRPLLNLSYALNYALSGDAVRSYHVVNWLLHAAAGCLLWGVLRRWFARVPSFATAAESLALSAALLWQVHPLLTESVVCIAQRSEVLCAVFYLGVLYAFTRAVEAADPGGRRNWTVAAVLLAAAGMATKEVMVTVPVAAWLVDRTFYAGGWVAAWRTRARTHLALAGTWLVLVALLISGGNTRGTSAGLGLGIDAWSYLLKQAEAIVLYLRLAFWPSPLVLDYGTAVASSLGEVAVPAGFVVALLAGTVWALVRRPLLGFAGAMFFLLLAPSSSFVPLVSQTMAEHRMYLPLAVVVAGTLVAIGRLPAAWRTGLVATLVLLAGGATVRRVGDYASVLGIWQDSVAKYPASARAQLNLGVELLRAGRTADARTCFEKAAALEPGYALAHYNAGLAWQAEGRTAEALAAYERAVQLAPANPDMRVNLGNALAMSGRKPEALAQYAEALRLKPAADVYYNQAEVLVALGRAGDADAAFTSALQLAPDRVDWRRRVASWHIEARRWPEAERHLAALVQAAPDDADARANHGNVLLLLGRRAEAAAEYEAALRVRPGDAAILQNLRFARGGPP